MFILSFDGKGEFSAANIPVDLVIKKHLKIKIYVETMIFIFFRIVLMNQKFTSTEFIWNRNLL